MQTSNPSDINCRTLISVVMPNFNGVRFVEQAICSVLKQTYTDFELIIIDDCSTDESVELIKKYCAFDKRIRLIQLKANQGVACARNCGISLAMGQYIALLDNDDLWEPDKLERQVRIAEAGAEIVYCSYDFIDENNKVIKHPFYVPEHTNFKHMLVSNVISCSTGFFVADLLKKNTFDLEYYHEDYVLWLKLIKQCVNAVGDKKVLMHYRQVSGSRSNKKINAAKERWTIYRKMLGLNLFESLGAFFMYAVNGLAKYYL